MTTQGRRLYDRGWRQGCVIELPATQHSLVARDTVEQVSVSEEMRLVLTTQDCDAVKPSERLPWLEAIGCVTDPERAKTVMANDARFFVLDPERGLVADRAVMATVSRDVLEELPDPDPPCGGDTQRARRFGIWLGARYDRPALPDEAVEHIQRPLGEAFRKLCSPGKLYHQLNVDLYEVRLVGAASGSPPFIVSLLFVLREGAPVEASELAIAEVIAEAGFAVEEVASDDALQASSVHLRRWIAAPPSRLTLAAYADSIPVSLASETYRGDEVVGAEPLDAESA
jgi:hypothetical protein